MKSDFKANSFIRELCTSYNDLYFVFQVPASVINSNQSTNNINLTVNGPSVPRLKRGDRILSDLNNFYRIRQGFCRILFDRNPGRIWSDFIVFRCIPMTSEPDSDEIRHGSERKRSDLQVGSLDLGYKWSKFYKQSKFYK